MTVLSLPSPLRAGARAALLTPGTYILMLGFFGFGGFAREAGFSLFEGVLMSASVWALPSQVLLVGAVVSGASLGAAALVVSASAVRFVPMMVSLVPLIAPDEAQRRGWGRVRLLGLVMVQAITSWIELQRHLPALAPEHRFGFALGLGGAIWVVNLAATALGLTLAGELPFGVQAGLALLLPSYFLFGLIVAWRGPADGLAIALGCALGPLLRPVLPGTSLLWAGLLAGSFAFALSRWLPIKGPRP